MGKLKLWTAEEDGILMAVSNSTNSKKWRKASDELRRRGYERTDIECRERYVNHLDPTVNKQSWSDNELQVLYNKYNQYGNKWFLIQKHLPGRTQTKIKNYFYGNIRYLLKIILKYVFGNARTGFVNDIKTETLLDMYQGKNNFQGNNLVQKTIKKLKYRVGKKYCQNLIKVNREPFQTFARENLLKNQDKVLASLKLESQSSQVLSQNQDINSDMNYKQSDCPQIQIVSSVNGKIDKKEEELIYLQKMAKMHFDWYLHYDKVYKDQLERTIIEKKETIKEQ